MMKGKLIGLELELMLTDIDGKVTNRADEVLHHPLNPGTLVNEGTYGVVEVISPPNDSLAKLASSFKEELIRLAGIVESLELKAIPISKVGPDYSLKKREDLRYSFQLVLGKDNDLIYDSACGTHIHLDHEHDLIGQYNLLQSLDPVFVLVSSSSFLMGKNTLNCSRVDAYRNHVFKDFPLHGQLLDYIMSERQLEQQNEQRLAFWQGLMGDHEESQHIFDRYNTCWGPIRLREKTIEVRNADSNLFSLVMAMAALYKGVNNYVFDKGLGVEIGNKKNEYGVTSLGIIIPSYETLKKMENEGIYYGLRSEVVHQYLSYLVGIAEEGLPTSERIYLEPFNKMLRDKRNIADFISAYARNIDQSVNDRIGVETAQQVNMFMHDLYIADLEQVPIVLTKD